MSDTSEPRADETTTGRHALGPHVVGQRVVVRHLLPDGRATDVLGTCTSWDAGSMTVDREGHGPVVIALADVVTGKPVPPRASVRARVSAQEVEEHVSALWDSITTEPLGRWLLRASPPHGGRLRRRGNSALAMAEPGIGWADAAFGVRRFYEALDQTPIVQVQRGSDVERTLAPLGFRPMGDGDAHAQLASVARALRSARAAAPDVAATYDERPGSVVVSLEGGAATGRGVLSGDWLLVESLAVDPAHRRRGLATAVLAEVLDWGASSGATTALLHVETDNEAAIALYERHGFVTHHTNRYLVA
ncbi:N-acetyltransferase [Nocardioides sp. zg-1228]|uniref:GNAT family N-acetyltransferase n=1 Tax=Nocardioides sp. zg-1228 TaxID=2763008 RepID=UPI0016427F14|nr:GNAT family N-acetyltransferase [Nocardioides sp. zg-1228]MBC2932976.1 GNAT family N-acetyltransferase [Nocardioides sp. zg-1228]QSF56826.1 GNAT family N-acetyltransferase [Nocardioides sp. zg-1228]